jgi:hypothetical protein
MTAALTLSDFWIGFQVMLRVGGLLFVAFIAVLVIAALVMPWDDLDQP